MTDSRLGRIRGYDLRSLNYRIRSITPPQVFQAPISALWPLIYYFDQGEEGACVGFGFTHELGAEPDVREVTEQFAFDAYHQIQLTDEFPGQEPEVSGTSVLAGAKHFTSLGYYAEYRWALQLNELVAAVGYVGPCVIGVDWYEGMFNTDAEGFIRPTGIIQGGHCILVVGQHIALTGDGSTYDPLLSHFILHNSWGPDWGVNGRCKLSFIDMLQLWPGGEFCLPIRRPL